MSQQICAHILYVSFRRFMNGFKFANNKIVSSVDGVLITQYSRTRYRAPNARMFYSTVWNTTVHTTQWLILMKQWENTDTHYTQTYIQTWLELLAPSVLSHSFMPLVNSILSKFLFFFNISKVHAYLNY